MSRLQRMALLGAATAALAAAACTETTAPPVVDPTTMAAAVTGFNSSLSQNAVYRSLLALDTSGVFTTSAVRAAALLAAGKPGVPAPAATRRAMLALAGRAPAAVEALFPANVLDSTFIWDTVGGGHYRIDHTTGGPANGVRFILYQVDTATERPSATLVTTGYVDLIDVSTPQANAIHVVVHAANLTAADYTISAVTATSYVTLAATGYVRDVLINGPQVTFDLSHTLYLSDTSVTSDYQASNGSATVSMVDSVKSGHGALDYIVSKGGSVEIVGTVTDTFNLAMKVNGTTALTMTGPGAAVSFKTPSGQSNPALGITMLTILLGFESVYYNLSLVFVPGLLVFG